MSKYSTEELCTEMGQVVESANAYDGLPLLIDRNERVIYAIIARLRAADALISAVREESPLSVNVRQAIAGYEEGK